MRYYYDLHMHSCLSPCACEDMTPMNIAGMAKLTGLDVIAVTDHNSCGNARAVIAASEKMGGPLVIPGMELETSENIHVVVLFESIDKAEAFEKRIWENAFVIKNNPSIYGRQIYMDSSDNELGEKEDLLLIATQIGIYEVANLAEYYGGAAFPAHVDREAHGAVKILGGLDKIMGFSAVEVAADQDLAGELTEQGYKIVYNSDAHYLHNISERGENNYLELEVLTIKNVLKALK